MRSPRAAILAQACLLALAAGTSYSQELAPGATREPGPRRLAVFICGSISPGPTDVFALMRSSLAQSLCLSVNKQPKTAAEIGAEIAAHELYVREKAEELVAAEVLKRTDDGRYLASFLAMDAGDYAELRTLSREAGPPMADLIRQRLPDLQAAYLRTPVARAGFSWDESLWPVVGVMLCMRGTWRALQMPIPDPPQRPDGGWYWLGGFEATADAGPSLGAGLNVTGGRVLEYGFLWLTGASGRPALQQESINVLDAIADGATTAPGLQAALGASRDGALAALQPLLRDGLVIADGERLSLAFPVYRQEDSDILTPVLDALAQELARGIMLPRLQVIGDSLHARGYGHLGEPYVRLLRWWMESPMHEEALRLLAERKVLPPVPSPLPATFGLIAWVRGLPLMASGL